VKIPVRILLIEDDEDDQFSFIDALNKVDNAVLQFLARNGKEALDYLSKACILPNLIFSDINMPVLNGIQCLKEIVKNPHINNIPVVMMSTDTGNAEVAVALGASTFIAKPADGKHLQRKLQQAITQYAGMEDSSTA
jgi:CheY-like chemotaxis protein